MPNLFLPVRNRRVFQRKAICSVLLGFISGLYTVKKFLFLFHMYLTKHIDHLPCGIISEFPVSEVALDPVSLVPNGDDPVSEL